MRVGSRLRYVGFASGLRRGEVEGSYTLRWGLDWGCLPGEGWERGLGLRFGSWRCSGVREVHGRGHVAGGTRKMRLSHRRRAEQVVSAVRRRCAEGSVEGDAKRALSRAGVIGEALGVVLASAPTPVRREG